MNIVSAQSGAVKAEFFTVAAEPYRETVRGVGTLRANEEVTVVAESLRRLVKIACEEGAEVKAGDLLFQLDDAELRTELLEIESRLALALANKQRAEGLLPSKAISQLEADIAAAEWRVLDAQRMTKLVEIEKTQIRAPFAGRLGIRKVSVGAFLSPTMPLIELQDLSRMKIDFSLPERYAGDIQKGQTFSFTVAGKGKVYQGSVTVIEPGIDPQTRSLRLRGVCDAPDGLQPGGFAEVTLPLAGATEALMIPTPAVVPSPRGHGVYVIREGKAHFQEITIGTRTEAKVQVLRGLAAGDVIATTNLNRIRPGVDVSLVKTP